MTPQIELSEIVKNKLESYKEKEGCKTFNEAVNLLISKKPFDLERYIENLSKMEMDTATKLNVLENEIMSASRLLGRYTPVVHNPYY